MAAVKALKEEKSMNKIMSLISRTEHLIKLPVMISKNTLRVVKIRIGFHNFRHNNIQILNFNFKILASHFPFCRVPNSPWKGRSNQSHCI